MSSDRGASCPIVYRDARVFGKSDGEKQPGERAFDCYTTGVIVTADIAFRYLEIAVAAGVLLCAGLLFLRRRPAGLVWVSVLAMGALVAHLFVEEGRWQLIPLYALDFVFAIWLAVPNRRPFRAGGLVLRILIVVLLVVPALLLPVVFPIFVSPAPSGTYAVGSVELVAPAEAAYGNIAVEVRYPLENRPTGSALREPYWTRTDVERNRLPGIPWLASTHLSLVPGRAVLRGARATGSHPLAIALAGPDALPSDYSVVLNQVASLGWIVVEVPPSVGADTITALVDDLGGGFLDAAFEGSLDLDRAVLLDLGWDSGVDLGLPVIRVGGGQILAVETAVSRYGIIYPDLRVPDAALTNRHLIVRPSRLLIGSSDVPPKELERLLTGALSALLAAGDLTAPVFAAEPSSDAATVAQEVVNRFAEAMVQPLPPPQLR